MQKRLFSLLKRVLFTIGMRRCVPCTLEQRVEVIQALEARGVGDICNRVLGACEQLCGILEAQVLYVIGESTAKNPAKLMRKILWVEANDVRYLTHGNRTTVVLVNIAHHNVPALARGDNANRRRANYQLRHDADMVLFCVIAAPLALQQTLDRELADLLQIDAYRRQGHAGKGMGSGVIVPDDGKIFGNAQP